MAEKEQEKISLEILQHDIKRLEFKFDILLRQIGRMDLGIKKVDAEQRKMASSMDHLDGRFSLILDATAAMNSKLNLLSRETKESFEQVDAKFEFIIEKLNSNRAEFLAFKSRVSGGN